MSPEDAYLSLRSQILTGEILPLEKITTRGLSKDIDIPERAARQVLNSLAEDGYIEKSKRMFVVASMSERQLAEWCNMMKGITQVSVARIASSSDERLRSRVCDRMSAIIENQLAVHDVAEEEYFEGAMAVVAELLGGVNSELSKIAASFVPPAFFRFLWIAESASDYFTAAAQALLKAFAEGDREGAIAAIPIYWNGVSESLITHRRSLNAAAQGRSGTVDILGKTREPDLAGRQIPIKAPRMRARLLPPLPERRKKALAFRLV